jgi:hypothetical protein
MSESEKKDKILAFLNLEENRKYFYQLIPLNEAVFKESPLNFSDIQYLVDHLVNDGYVIRSDSSFRYKFTITPFLESGGYTGQDNRRRIEAEEKRSREEASDRKMQFETKLAKWQVKIFWPAFIFTVIGSALGIVSFIMQLSK